MGNWPKKNTKVMSFILFNFLKRYVMLLKIYGLLYYCIAHNNARGLQTTVTCLTVEDNGSHRENDNIVLLTVGWLIGARSNT